MLPFRRFKRDAYMLDQCVTMVEDTVHEIGEYVNKDEDMTDSMTQTLSHLWMCITTCWTCWTMTN